MAKKQRTWKIETKKQKFIDFEAQKKLKNKLKAQKQNKMAQISEIKRKKKEYLIKMSEKKNAI